jgi:hypothetical protein
MRLYIGLLHYPVRNKHGHRIASAVTTLDIHDMARLARTYEVKKFYVVTPLEDQQGLVARILSHWTEGYGATYNCHRKDAMGLVAVSNSLEHAAQEITLAEGERPLLIATDASWHEDKRISYDGLRALIHGEQKAVSLLFGTAWGLAPAVYGCADFILDPICGRGSYNHLSVRSAAAIILDRLAGGA